MRLLLSVMTAVCCLLASLVAAAAQVAQTGKRVALVIGNAKYEHIAALPNVLNDAKAMAALFEAAKFDSVVLLHDQRVDAMRRELLAFAERAADADVAVVFYAGHGIEVDRVNYLIPVDARLKRDLAVKDETVSLDRVLELMEPAHKLRVVILDACRENPFGKSMKLTEPTRTVTRGLGRIEVEGNKNTLVAFATEPNAVAEDGTGLNSPFTAALVKHLATPGLDLRIALGNVRDEVMASTAKKQRPYLTTSLGGGTIALVPAPPPPSIKPAPSTLELPPPPPPTTAGSGVSATDTVRICRDVAGISSLSVLGVMADEHIGTPAGRCIAARIGELTKADTKIVSVAPPKVPEQSPKVTEPPSKVTEPRPKAPDAPPKYDPPPQVDADALRKYGPPPTPYGEMPKADQPAPVAPPKTPGGPPPTLTSAPVTECDRLATSPGYGLPGVQPVPLVIMDASRAIAACEDAVGRYPSEPRLQAMLGRAFHKAGRYDEARRWYEQASAKGDPMALNNLGSLYESGQGVAPDFAMARRLYEQAAEKGYTYALRNIGMLYEYGKGVPQDYGIARSWYDKAVQKGETAGMHDIARLYQDGKGVPRDLGIARSWYEKASEKGDIVAPFDLAGMLARGEGGPRDPRAAARYLLAAARAGNPNARQDLDGDMRSWDDQVRMAVLELLTASGDYRGRVGGWWDRMCSDAARAYYIRRS